MSTNPVARQPSILTRRSLVLGLSGLPAWTSLPALVGLPVLLGACGSTLLPKPAAAPARFTLDDGLLAQPAPTAPVGAPVLIVAQPRAAPGCDDRHMVYLRSAGHLQVYAYHEWLDTPAQMLAPMMVQALQSTGAFAAVLQAPSTASVTLRLETVLLRLQQDFTRSPSQLRLTLRAVLIDSVKRQVLGWREFDHQVPAPSENGEGGVIAARQATRLVLAQLGSFCGGLAATRTRP